MWQSPLQSLPRSPALVAVLGVMGLALSLLGVREIVGALRARARRPVRVGDLRPGQRGVVASGVVRRADASLEAPLTGEDCLAYAWRATELRTGVGAAGGIDVWGQRGPSGREAVPFLLKDGTGRVLVDPGEARLRLAEEWVEDPLVRPASRDESDLRQVVDLLARTETHGVRCYESRLSEGETVTVRGRTVTDEGVPDDRRRDRGVVLAARSVADATPRGVAGRSLREGLVSTAAGLFVLAVVAVLSV